MSMALPGLSSHFASHQPPPSQPPLIDSVGSVNTFDITHFVPSLWHTSTLKHSNSRNQKNEVGISQKKTNVEADVS